MKNYKWYLLIGMLFTIFAFLSPVLFTFKGYTQFGPTTGFIGDTIGGLTAPFLSLAGSILVFAALKAQIDANKAVQEQFKVQQTEDRKRQIEADFYRLFDLHLKIVSESHLYASELSIKNLDADYFFNSIIHIEYPNHLSQLAVLTPEFTGTAVFENSVDLLEWAMFDSKNVLKDEEHKWDEALITALNFFNEKMKAVTFRYFNNVFMTIRKIEASDLHNQSEKADWMALYLNHFSYGELKWLFWMSFHPEHVAIQPVLDQYACFDRISYDDITSKSYWGYMEKYLHLEKRTQEYMAGNEV